MPVFYLATGHVCPLGNCPKLRCVWVGGMDISHEYTTSVLLYIHFTQYIVVVKSDVEL